MGKVAVLHRKVIRVLRKHLKDIEDALDDVPSTGRITGVLISSSFEGLDHSRRQKRLEAALKKGLTPAECARIGPIATLTPSEAYVKPI